jgi:alpha-ribazole phosphatase
MTTHPESCDVFFIRHAPVVKQSGHLPPADPPMVPREFDVTPFVSQLPTGAEWHVSPLLRTRQTADLLTPSLMPAGMSPAPQLVEMDFGSWHDRPVAEVWDQIKDGPLHNWTFLTADHIAPQGESFAMLVDRVAGWMHQLESGFSAIPRIVITHAGVIRAAMALALATPLDHVVGIPVPHFGVLKLTLMDPARATETGGAWLFGGLTDPGIA